MAAPVAPRTDLTATLAGGRRISWAEYGSSDGAPLLLLHGTPGSRLQFRWMHAAAAGAGVRVVTPERPGYGAGESVPGGTTFARYADDLRELLDLLDLSTVTLCAVSGGGGFGAAAAIRHPERFSRLLLVSAGIPAPRAALRGMFPPVRLLLFLSGHAPALTGRLLVTQAARDLDSPSGRWGRRFLPAADRRVLDVAEFRDRLTGDTGEALRQGPDAAVRDLVLGRGPLGVDLADLRVETVLLHGAQDANVPVGVARWVAAQVPGARLIVRPDAGHLFALERPELILEWVA